ncbi:hypothetical protein [Kitasatospora camelliae]|uniref:Uncharacterized protein n=1 Tax=Kitasatospora camelliae TaxID=3156397 RepID=A0AAU8K3Y3_9ACTN
MQRSLAEVVGSLADRCGTVPGDPADEHDRWAVYRRALAEPACLPDLFDAVALEPDSALVLTVVLNLLGALPAADRPVWIGRLGTGDSRAHATRRARELAVLQSGSVTELLTDPSVQDLWSDWLQLGLAAASPEPAVLGRLADHGRTRRIRRLATTRARTLGR